MLRKFLVYAIPFLLPFALYAVWLAVSRRKALAARQGTLPGWRAAPWSWLAVTGVGLLILSFIAVALMTGDEPGGTYTPPRYIDGKVVPAETH